MRADLHPRQCTAAAWLQSPRVIEFDPGDALLVEAMLQKAGPEAVHHYLAVLPAGRTPVGPHVPHLVVTGSLPVRHNSAEVLVLAGRARWQAIRWGNLRHARWVILRWDVSLAALVALVALLWHAVRGKLSYAGRVALGELPHRRWCFSFAARRPAQHRSARRYVPFAWGIAGFLHQLAQAQVRHVVLRWFETLPTLPPGEDLDLLVADEDLSKVEALLDAAPGVFPCDLYSVSGLPGTDLDGLPYFPPFLAQQIIDTARPHPSGARVPDPQRHFLSLAYHVVYHKGPSSGLPPGAGSVDTPQRPDHAQALSRFAWSAMRTTDSSCGPARRVSRGRGCTAVDGEHDYAGVLNQLAAQLGWPLQPKLRSLDTLLAEQGWRPPRDMLLRLARRRPFLRTLLDGGRSQEAPPGLAVFILRQAAVVDQACDRLIDRLRHEGFQVLAIEPLDPPRAHAASRTLRGGNWGQGPWPASGGPPAVAVVVCDPEPIPPTPRQRRAHPELDNARLLRKERLRQAFNAGRPRFAHCNVVHSSDNADEALDYLRCLMPQRVEELCRQAREVRAQFVTTQPVIYALSQYRRRAKTEIIEFGGQLAVKKTFKPQQRAFCQREKWALAYLSRQIPAVPPLLAAGPDYVIYPYYRDCLRFRCADGRLLPLKVARQAIAALKQVYEAGYALIDAHPENLVVDPQHGLKLIDFEFLYRYRQRPATFEASYDMAGCPEDFDGSIPDGGPKNYARHWQPYVGLSLHSLLYDPPWLQHVKRGLYRLAALPRWGPRRLRAFLTRVWQVGGGSHQPHPSLPASFPAPVAAAEVSRRAA